jgi:glucokinase
VHTAMAESTPGLLGIAAIHPESLAVAPIVAQLALKFRGAGQGTGAILSGTAAAAAEAWVGAARGVNNVVFFAVGQHTIGGIVRDGAAITGARGRAGSVGWLSLNPVEREDYRKAGCLEAEVSAAGIVRRLIWRIKAGDRSRVQDTVKDDFGAITVDHVLEAARAGDGVSISVMRDTAKYLGMAAANLVVVTDPEALVLGGIMASAADLLLDPLRTEIARRLPKSMTDTLRIETATLGDEGAAIGAAHLGGVSGR